MNWEELLKYLGSGTVLIGMVAWLVRSLFIHILNRDVEIHKILLKAENDRNLEQLKTQLQLKAFEHEIKYSKLHNRRAEVIAELYTKIRSVQLTSFPLFDEYISGHNDVEFTQNEKITIVKFRSVFRELNELYIRNRIFFKEQTCLKIDKMIDVIAEPVEKIADFESIPDGISVDTEQLEDKYNS